MKAKKTDLEKQVEALAKLKERNETERRKAEQDWRQAMQRDTAGHMLNVTRYVTAQIASLQAQIDAHHPIGVITRTVDAITAKLAEIDQRLTKLEKKLEAEEL